VFFTEERQLITQRWQSLHYRFCVILFLPFFTLLSSHPVKNTNEKPLEVFNNHFFTQKFGAFERKSVPLQPKGKKKGSDAFSGIGILFFFCFHQNLTPGYIAT
jgi:hypothetical protein